MRHSDSKTTFDTGAQRDTTEGKGTPSLISPVLIHRLGILLEKGAKHYGADNWTKGMPYRRTADSMIRHIFQWLAGDEEEDHLAAVCFGAMCLMTYEEAYKDYLPKGTGGLDDRDEGLKKILASILTSPSEKPKIEAMAKAKKCRTCRNAVELNSPTDQCFACRFPESLEPEMKEHIRGL